jgi:hypothetical protein
MGGYGLEGGLYGAAQGAGQTYTGNAQDYASNALKGGALSAALGAPFGAAARVAPRSTAEVPNSQDLAASTRDRYEGTYQSPVRYDQSMYRGGLDDLERQLLSADPGGRTNQVKSDQVWAALNHGRSQVASDPAGISPYEIDAVRQQLTGVQQPGASLARQWLDDFMASGHAASHGTAADRAAVSEQLALARAEHRARKRTQTIEETNQYAEDKASDAGSGQNVENTYRQKLSNLLNPKSAEGKWYTPDEKAAIRSAKNRDILDSVKRWAGNFMGGGGGAYSGALTAGGAGTAFATGDWKPFAAGIGIPATGWALKQSGNRSMVRSANELADTMARNSPLYRERAAVAPMEAGPGLSNPMEASRNAITNQMLEQLRIRGFMNAPEQALLGGEE